MLFHYRRRTLRLLLMAAMVLGQSSVGLAHEGGGPEPAGSSACDGSVRAAAASLRSAEKQLKRLKKDDAPEAQIAKAEAKVAKAEARLKAAKAAC